MNIEEIEKAIEAGCELTNLQARALLEHYSSGFVGFTSEHQLQKVVKGADGWGKVLISKTKPLTNGEPLVKLFAVRT